MSSIKTIRARLRLTQQALAEGIGCTQGNVWHYEQGQMIPPAAASRLIEFAAGRGLVLGFDHIYGGVPIPELIGSEGSPEVKTVEADRAA